MKTLLRLVKRFVIFLINMVYFPLLNFLRLQDRRLIKNVPCYSQWESREMVDDIVSGKVGAEDDPLWKQSGAITKLEYVNWSWNACGMACLQMILAYKTGKKIPLVSLCQRSLNYGCYELIERYFDKGEYLKSLPGMFYKPFVRFIEKEFDIESRISTILVTPEILREIARGKFVIASVNGNIRDAANPPKKGGHLVLVLGYDFDKKIFYLHNPSGLYKKSQEYFEIKFIDFERFFDHKGIIID